MSQIPNNGVIMIYDDDEDVINFMADLKNRKALHDLTKATERNKLITGCILTNHAEEDMLTLLLLRDPLGYTKEPNVLTLFYCKKIEQLINLFTTFADEVETHPELKFKRSAIVNILYLLSRQKEILEYKETQTNHMG